MKQTQRLARFFDKQLTSDLKSLVITYDKSGVYEVFGKYIIKQDAKGLFSVTSTLNNKFSFSSLKNAMCWCTLHNAGLIHQANRLQNLDMKISSIELDLAIHKKLYKNSNPHNKLIYLIKLQEDSHKRKMILKEIETYINSSKSIQNKKFTTAKI